MKKNSCWCRLSAVMFIVCAFTGFASFADKPEPAGKSFSFSELGQKASRMAETNLLGIKAVDSGAEIVCKLQAIEASVRPSGISIKSTSDTEGRGAFSMKVAGFGRVDDIGRDGSPSRPFSIGAFGETALPSDAIVKVSKDCAQVIRPELVEEYTVSGDGIRQDFIVSKRPEGSGDLSLVVGLGGATSELSGAGLKIRLTETGREFAYSKLLVTDAAGKKLPAEFIINSPNEFIVAVNDSGAVYPVRIDPTISDVNWIGMFPGGVDGEVSALVSDSSGNLYAGGTFTTAGGVEVNSIAKWNGSAWNALGSGTDEAVSALAFDSSGDLYVGGSFTNAGEVENTSYIAKWNVASSTWSALGTGGVDSPVLALAFNSGNLYAGGNLTTAGGVAVQGVAKWNGSAWSAIGTPESKSACVNAMAFNSGNLYTGGNYTDLEDVVHYGVGKWNGSTWSWLGKGMDGDVYALAFDSSGNLYAGGIFTAADDVAVNGIAKWGASKWSALGTGIEGGQVNALAFSAGSLYVGGMFASAGVVWDEETGLAKSGVESANNIAKWNGSKWSGLGTGVNGEVNALAFDSSGKLYAGGATSIVKWNGSVWNAFGSGTDEAVSALAFDSSGNLYVGGMFMTAGGVDATNIAKWNGSKWSALGTGVDGQVNVLTFNAGSLYVGGMFASAGVVWDEETGEVKSGVEFANNIAKWNGSKWSALGTGVEGEVKALAFNAGSLYVGGMFASAGVVLDEETGEVKSGVESANNIAKWSGSKWSALGTGVDVGGQINALAFSAGNLYAGGMFINAGGVDANNIARWNVATSTWSALGAGVDMDGQVNALACDSSGNLYAGGMFINAGEFEVNNIARWNGSDWSALGTGVGGGTVSALAFDSSGSLYVGGMFMSAGAVYDEITGFAISGVENAGNIAKWDGSEWSALGTGMNNQVNSLAFNSSGSLYVGGMFTTAGDKASLYLAKCIFSAPPGAPTAVTAVRGNTKATVSFASPVSDGGSQITSYEVTSVPEGITATGPASPIAVTRLTNGKAYKFTVRATNAIGPYGPASAPSKAVTPATVPDAPVKVTATAGNEQATVSFAPAFNGGSAITGYTVTSNPEGMVKTGNASPLTVTGLTNGTAYKFTVRATNVLGTSDPSEPSTPVTPMVKIATAAISGVIAPATGEVPAVANDTAEYTAETLWSPADDPFVSGTVYTATIAITPRTGYTLTGVTANFFKVAGAATTNPACTGASATVDVKAVFPKTAVTIAKAEIAGVTAPVKGATAVTKATATAEYTAGIVWSPMPVAGKFAAATAYMATITITPKTGYTLSGVPKDFFTVGGVKAENDVNTGIVKTPAFPQTADGAIAIAAISGVTVPATGEKPASANNTAEYTVETLWSPADDPFVAGTPYTAKITITPRAGHTLTGVPANFFKVAGAATTNPACTVASVTVDVMAVFPKTAVTIANKAIAGVTTPVKGATAATKATATAEYTAAIVWSPEPVSGKFAPATAYMATITITPKTGYTLSGVSKNFFTVAGVETENDLNTGVVTTSAFPETAESPLTAIGKITPAAKVGVVLTAGTLTPAGATATYLWTRADALTGKYTGIKGATGKTYIPSADDVNKFLKVEARGTVGYPGTVISAATAAVAAGVPGAPVIGTANPGNALVTVEFTSPISDGGSAIKSYTVTSSPGAKAATGTASPLTVTGLTNGIAYTFTVKAANAVGIGPASAASDAVTPVAPLSFTSQPLSTSVTAGEPASFTVKASGTSPAFQWQFSTDGGIEWADLENNIEAYSGVTTATLTVINATAAISRYQYRCVATNDAGSSASAAAILRVASADIYLDGEDDFATSDNWSAPTMSPSKGGRLEFTDIGIDPDTVKGLEYTAISTSSDDIVIREWTPNVGSYAKNWEVQVDVHLATMGLLNGQYANLNLVVVNAADAINSFALDMDNMSNMCVAIDRYNNGLQAVYNFEGDLNSYYTGYNTGLLEIEDPSTDAALRISFDCFTKELTSWYDADGATGGYNWTLLQTVNIGSGEDYDWGMTDNGTFAVFLAGGTGGGTDIVPVLVNSGDAYFGNFQASTTEPFTVSSENFGNGMPMDAKYANFGVTGGDNISPELSWEYVPADAVSIAVTCIDTLPAAGKFVHWMVINIPADSTGLIEGASLNSFPAGSKELYNSFFGLGLGDNYGYGYGGPEPPKGSKGHTYVFTVYALSEELFDYQPSQTAPFSEDYFLTLIEGKILAKAQWTGTFSW